MHKTKIEIPSRDKKIYGKHVKYVEIGAIEYFRPSKNIWIKDKDLLKYGDYLELPMKNVELYQIDENNLILTKGNKNLFYVIIDAHRKEITQIQKDTKSVFCLNNDEVDKIYTFEEYKSKNGKMGGISGGALILTKKEKVKVKWTKSKEEKQKESGIVTIDINGDIIEEEIFIKEQEETEKI